MSIIIIISGLSKITIEDGLGSVKISSRKSTIFDWMVLHSILTIKDQQITVPLPMDVLWFAKIENE